MIKMKIEKKGLERLIRNLKKLRFDLLRETSEMMVDLNNTLNESYTRSINELVYEQYEPMDYKRTGHLRGAHGALVQVLELTGDKKKLRFYIDGESRDPVDGETWDTKADNLEKGSIKMTVGFDRPFVNETQLKLEWETKRMRDAMISKYRKIIRDVGR